MHLTTVPFYAQEALQCGPAALAMALDWSGLAVLPEDLVPQVYTPERRGSLQTGLITATRRNRRLAYPIEGLTCLFQEVAAGHPVIVLQNLGLGWLPQWHYAVVVGYDLSQRHIVLHTGTYADRIVSLDTFDRTWQRAQRWGLLVLPPGRMPACAEEQTYLKAVLGLEQTAHMEAAVAALGPAVNHWPNSLNVHLAQGNALYAIADLGGAAQAFRQATELDPLSGTAFNNLAHVLAELGELDQALASARQAVALGGPNMEVYRETLQEIEEMMKKQPFKMVE